ncbi:hypothetical protein [Pseudobutyrivibrio xylanivorans]|uniref:Uncharacterized protein n=1 Tax=Pseudobutyrivibrio xylanivorans TaxID=185007 RepID=A0A5P6VVR5_PSEXY|nr:hypothetical protein [Pseudobutyrivibrio xylanivorans]QFJ55351.1 hypothetical protein FXF36_11000 [Pseudobutyrivibrio xylanivorans]
MACFLVPAGEGVVTEIVKKVESKKELNSDNSKKSEVAVPLSRKLGWLSKLLWGGSVLLAFEHVWHGEVVPFFPFLTAMSDPSDKAEMLHEMSTVGVSMAVLITAIWIAMCVTADIIVKRPLSTSKTF